MSERKNYDVIVIGAGPGGLTAALYAARANLKVVILDRGIYGGQMNNTAGIDNYPGFVDIQGPELGEKMYQTAMNAGAEFAYGDVQKIEQDGNQKIIKTDSGEYEAAKKVTGIDIPYTIGPRRGGDPDSLVADSSKARKVLGWKPKHENVDDVIATAWNWHKSHPKGYEDK